jgi:PBP1b-binding outer membrane lipoprotein LpoB
MKILLTAVTIALLLAGCSQTWQGAQKDSSTIWNTTKKTTNDAVQGTKRAIHKATE